MGTRKVAVSIPERLYEDAEACASEMEVNRSQLYALALAAFLHDHKDEWITERMNEVYSKPENSEDVEFRSHAKAHARKMLEGTWK